MKQFRFFLTTTLILAAAALLIAPAHATITTTGNIDPTSDPTSWGTSTTAYVGRSANGSLSIDSGSTVKSRYIYMGNDAGMTGTVYVDGTNSKWTASSANYLGYNGTGVLNITNGGAVSNAAGYMGYNAGSSGTAIVDGSGSTWTNSSLYIGRSGTGVLSVTNGGTVSSSATSYIGYSGSGSGTATVTGPGSKWTNSSTLYVGYNGTGTLNIINGGTVSNASGYIGYVVNRTGYWTGLGTVNVDGAGSKWTNSSLNIGNNDTSVLNISNNGNVSATGTTTIGAYGTINLNGGSLTTPVLSALSSQITGTGTISTQEWTGIGNLDLVYDSTHGLAQTLTLSDATHNLTINYDLSGSTPRNMYVGYDKNGSLTVKDGLTVASSNGYLGYIAGSTGTATVTGPGSKWSSSNLYVGYNGTGALNILNGSSVAATGTTSVGASGTINFGSSGGTLTTGVLSALSSQITGTGTITTQEWSELGNLDLVYDSTHGMSKTFTLSDATRNLTVNYDLSGTTARTMYVGTSGNGSLTVKDGLTLASSTSYIGYNAGSMGTATVTGSGTKWTNTGNLYVGNSGAGTLTIGGGAAASNTTGYIGNNAGSTGSATVNAATWTNTGALYVGNSGTGTLDISGGATVSNTTGYIGYNAGSTGTVTTRGTGTKWTNTGDLVVGSSGTGTLNILNSSVVSAAGTTSVGALGTITLGGGTLTTPVLSASSAQVTGTGTITTQEWSGIGNADLVYDSTHGLNKTFTLSDATHNLTINYDLSGSTARAMYVGSDTSGSLAIKDGLSLTSSTGYIGLNAGSTGTATVDGSKWTNTGDLYVGNSGTGTLRLANGGTVTNGNGYVGNNAGSTGTATVDGVGSTWTTGGNLYVGNSGTGSLSITNGGTVSNSTGSIGANTGSIGTVAVDGPGSAWTNSSTLYVGNSGTGTLSITNGGNVGNGTAYIGYNAGSTGTVTVDGFGAAWTTNGNLIVGNSGTGTLNILNDGMVSVTGTTSVGTQGAIKFGGGTLMTPILSASSAQLTGTGAITTQEWSGLGNMDLVYDSTHGLNQALALHDAARNLTINYDLSGSTPRNMYVGYDTNGSLTIKDGLVLTSSNGYIGYNTGSTGTATIDGTGSAWNLTGSLYAGGNGVGTLNVNNGGIVTVAGTTVVGPSGALKFNGGTLTTTSLYTAPSKISGTGTINTSGIVGDMALVFDAAHGTTQTLTMNGTTVNLNQSSAGALGAGHFGSGSLTIKDGVAVASSTGYLGYNAGSTGTATVTGAGSTWSNSGALYVGNSGTGVLNVTNGGTVTSSSSNIGNNAGSTGSVVVDGVGSTWSGGTITVGNFGTASLRITNGGTVRSGVGFAFIGYDAGSKGNVLIDGAGSSWAENNLLYLGYNAGSSGTLTITNGGLFATAKIAEIGLSGSGTATVDGKDSKLLASYDIYIGDGGTSTGKLYITNGGEVSTGNVYIGGSSGSIGTVKVDGSGSKLTSAGGKNILVGNGNGGTGYLSISNGGLATTSTFYVQSSPSVFTIDVGKGSSLSAGSVSNSGTIRLVAGPGAAAGTYTPMSYGSLSGNAPQALGGIWNDAAHTVTVSGAATANGIGGATAAFNLATNQRALITDSATGLSVGAAFQAGTADVTLTATAIGPTALAALQKLLASGNAVLSAWTFSTTGTTVSDINPAYLSLHAGPDQSLSTLNIWHYDGSTWSAFTANDLAYDGKYASFTVTGFSGYALSGTAPVPVPAAVWLLGSGLAGLAALRRRGKKRTVSEDRSI